MTRLTLALVSISCLLAASLPQAVTKEVIYRDKPVPKMFVECSDHMRVERDRICRARQKSQRTRL